MQTYGTDAVENRRWLTLAKSRDSWQKIQGEYNKLDDPDPSVTDTHRYYWETLRPIATTTWNSLSASTRFAGLQDVFTSAVGNRSKEWWIQYCFQEALGQDKERAYDILDRIIVDQNVIRPGLTDVALKQALQDLIAVGFYSLSQADAVSHQQMVDEPLKSRKLAKDVERPSWQKYGLGFRSEDRTKDQILADKGLFPKVETTNPDLRTRWNFDQPWFPLERGKMYFRLTKGDNDLDTLVSIAPNIIDVSKFPLLEELAATSLTEANNIWSHDALVSVVRVRKGIDTQAMQAATEPTAFGHGEKAAFRIPDSDIVAFLTIRRTWPKGEKDSNKNLHELQIVGDIDWLGRTDEQLARILADADLLKKNESEALRLGAEALQALKVYLAYLQKNSIKFDTPKISYAHDMLDIPPGSSLKQAAETQGAKAKRLDVLYARDFTVQIASYDKDDSVVFDYEVRSRRDPTTAVKGKTNGDGKAEIKGFRPSITEVRFPGHLDWFAVKLEESSAFAGGRFTCTIQ